MIQTWDANLSYVQLYIKLYVGNLTKAQGRIASLKALQLQGERQAYTTRQTNVAMIKKQQNAWWNSVELIINKIRELQPCQSQPGKWLTRYHELIKYNKLNKDMNVVCLCTFRFSFCTGDVYVDFSTVCV